MDLYFSERAWWWFQGNRTCRPRSINNILQGGSNMTGTDLCVNQATSVPVIFEPPCIWLLFDGTLLFIIYMTKLTVAFTVFQTCLKIVCFLLDKVAQVVVPHLHSGSAYLVQILARTLSWHTIFIAVTRPLGKCWDIILKGVMASSFHVFPNSVSSVIFTSSVT